jgi:hypothetical protein
MFDFLRKPKQKLKDDGSIDFSTKRLGLEHNPKVLRTEDVGATLNEKAAAILKFRKSFVPKIAVKAAQQTKTRHGVHQ